MSKKAPTVLWFKQTAQLEGTWDSLTRTNLPRKSQISDAQRMGFPVPLSRLSVNLGKTAQLGASYKGAHFEQSIDLITSQYYLWYTWAA